MKPRVEILARKRLVGHRIRMSLTGNRTFDLWKGFMPRRREITDRISDDLFSVKVYEPSFDFLTIDPRKEFDKWAAMEVSGFDHVPPGMEQLVLEEGLYAVFGYKGSSGAGEVIFRYIFETWLPASGYRIDDRPHFEILGDKYKNEDPDSEEEIWIPVRALNTSA